MKKQVSPKIVSLTFGILVICFIVAFYVLAWTEPTQAPPGCPSGQPGCDAPINVGPTGQSKVGGLILNTGGADVGLIIDDNGDPTKGFVGIGTTSPLSKLAVQGLPTSPPDGSGAQGVLCITNQGNIWIGEDGTCTVYNYSLDYLGRKYSGYGAVPWYDLIVNSEVLNTDVDLVYSSAEGNWLPADTHVENLRLNVDGEHNQGGADPRTGFQVKYRVWRDTNVRVQSKTWGNHGDVKLNRTDTFQRQSDTVILLNGSPININIGATYEIQRFDWNPGDNGDGYSFLRIINVSSEYFDIHQEVWEYDEQYDSAYARIDSYIEPAP